MLLRRFLEIAPLKINQSNVYPLASKITLQNINVWIDTIKKDFTCWNTKIHPNLLTYDKYVQHGNRYQITLKRNLKVYFMLFYEGIICNYEKWK